MHSYPKTFMTLVLKPSAMTPVLMSASALTLVAVTLLISGNKGLPDEGAAAHLFQILVVAQIPIMAFFIIRWIRSSVRASLSIALIQMLAIAAALLPVWYFHL